MVFITKTKETLPMSYCNTVFKQVLDIIPKNEFDKLIKRYESDWKIRTFNSWNHFVCLAYAQLRQKVSLRDIQVGLESQSNKLFHLGVTSVKKSTFSDANNRRDHRLFRDLFFILLAQFHKVSGNKRLFDRPLIALDATFISLCTSLFPWAKYQKIKGGIKLHYALDVDHCVPEFMVLSDGNGNEKRFVKQMPLKSDSILVCDRGYFEYSWLNSLDEKGIVFVIRPLSMCTFNVVGQLDSAKNNPNIIKDEAVLVAGRDGKQKYSKRLRRILYFDQEGQRYYEYLTNNFNYSPQTIADIYKKRWDIEQFFRWIKQNLKIKSFLGSSQNAVLSQIWVAMITYLLLKYLKKQTGYSNSLLTLTRIIMETAFERFSIIHILKGKPPSVSNCLSLPLFNSA